MTQHVVVYIIVSLSVFYLVYKWKIQKMRLKKFDPKEVPKSSPSCGSGCHSCSVPKKGLKK